MNDFEQYVLPTYKRFPITFVKGEGVYLWDEAGDKYLDFFSGWAVSNLGHCHPKIVKAVTEQVCKLIHIPNIFYNETQGALATQIAKHSFGGKTFFCNSGSEANEAAIKLARKRSKTKHELVSLVKSFHGRTLGAMTITGQESYKKGFEPLPEGFSHCDINDSEQLKQLVNEKTAAIFIEPIQGEGGVHIVTEEFMRTARTLCDKFGALLIFDEVQTGMGRTGKMFAYQHYGIEPDVMTLAKSLGGGVAIGALVVKPELDNILVPGTHASTFGGNPLACAAGLAMFEAMEEEKTLEHVYEIGRYLMDHMLEFKANHKQILLVRGIGLMIGIELDGDGTAIVDACREKKLLINCTQGNVLRLMPALNIKKDEVDQALAILGEALS